jgi:rhamnose transport system substrate-binding protein
VRERLTSTEALLAAVLLGEVALFGVATDHFLSLANALEIARFATVLGLLAVAMTPVIVTGGIDLSVGAMLGLASVVMGLLWQEWHWPIALAAAGAIAAGAAGGALNACFVAALGVPPLIVTLATLALFRGMAEGLTGGALSFSGFPPGFQFLGQGYLAGIVPVQLPLLVLIASFFYVLLERTTIGRSLYAIGWNAEGARYAAIPVRARLALVYVLSGTIAGLAAIVYVAHIGQARSDAGMAYELHAITAVVLGGASVTGGRGSVAGTLLGLFILAVLQNGLQLAGLPSELIGVMTGLILVTAIAVDQARRRSRTPSMSTQEVPVKNSQLAVVCATILAGAFVVAGTNVWLVRSLIPQAASQPTTIGASAPAPAGRRLVIAMMPKAKGDPYFVSCRLGAEEAARELGVDLLWDGPTGLDAARQNELVESWITRRVDAIAVSVENRASISTVLRKARERGIKVLTWDADAEADARDFFVNQATPEGIGTTLVDEAARLMGGTGDFAIVTGALAAPNQNAWIAVMQARLAAAYPNLRLVVIRPSDDDRDKAFAEAQTIMRVHPNVKLLMAISAPAVPGAAEAVRQAGRRDVQVMGLSLPNMNKPYVHAGVVQTVVLWNTTDLGYLTVRAAAMAVDGRLASGDTSIDGGRLGPIAVQGDEVLLGTPLVMTRDNIDKFDF